MHRAKGDRLVRNRVLPVCDNTPIQGKNPLKSSWNRRANGFGTWYATFGMLTIRPEARQRSLPAGKILNNLFGYTNDHTLVCLFDLILDFPVINFPVIPGLNQY